MSDDYSKYRNVIVNEHGVECWFYKEDQFTIGDYSRQLNSLFPAGTYNAIHLTGCPPEDMPMFVHTCLGKISEEQTDVYFVCADNALDPTVIEKVSLVAEFYAYRRILWSDAGLTYNVNQYRHNSGVEVDFIPSAQWLKMFHWPIFKVPEVTRRTYISYDPCDIIVPQNGIQDLSEACLHVCKEDLTRLSVREPFVKAVSTMCIPVIFGHHGIYEFLEKEMGFDMFRDLIPYTNFDHIQDSNIRRDKLTKIINRLIIQEGDYLKDFCADNASRFVKNIQTMNNYAFRIDNLRNTYIKEYFQSGSKTVEYLY